MKILKALLIPCLLTATVAMAQNPTKAQSQPTAQTKTDQPPQFFRLKFVLKELDGNKVIDSRTYRTEISAAPYTNHPSRNAFFDQFNSRSIRASSEVPYYMGLTYHTDHIEVDIDCSKDALIGDKLGMSVTAEIMNLTKSHTTPPAATSTPHPPIVQQSRWSSEVLIPIGKLTTLFTSDDPASTRTMELDLIATPLN